MGLTLASGTGVISGTPTAIGTTNFTIRVTNGTCSQTIAYSIVVVGCPTITFTNTTATTATIGVAYSLDASATSSIGTLSYSILPILPAGLLINASTGAISGTPTALAPLATYTVTATSVQNTTCPAVTQTYSFEVVCPIIMPVITPSASLSAVYCSAQTFIFTSGYGAGYTVTWNINGNISTGTAATYTVSATSPIILTVTVQNQIAACATPVTITENYPPVVILTSPPAPTITVTPNPSLPYCAGQVFTFTTNYGASYAHAWRINGQALTGASVTYAPASANDMEVEVSVTALVPTGNTCKSSITRKIYKAGTATISTVSTATGVCPGTEFTLSLGGLNSSVYTYQWQSASNINSVFVDIPNATSSTFISSTQTNETVYQCVISCGSRSNVSTPITVLMNAPSACALCLCPVQP